MLCALSFGIVLGASLTHFLILLPDSNILFFWCLVFITCVLVLRIYTRRLANGQIKRLLSMSFGLIASVMCAMTWTVIQAQSRVSDSLSVDHENVVTRLSFLVQSMSQDQSDQQRFQVQVLDPVPTGVPRQILVSWQDSSAGRLTVLPGQVWRAALVLKRPHGASNPSGFDYEGHLFQKNIRALGKVRGVPRLISDHPDASMTVIVARVRHNMRQAMRKILGPARYAPVLIALAIGDQDSVSASDWDIFNRTGITHLVSISGSHVTMLAAFGGVSMLWLWKRIRFGRIHPCELIPSKVMAACAALSIAFLYCLLAGWGVPARRTFFMLLVIGMALLARLPISPNGVLGIAAAVVTLLDPWSPLATGFWLSFGAVLVLFAVGTQAVQVQAGRSRAQKILLVVKESARMQWLITLAMTPVLAFLFQQVSLVSPFANAIAIPVVTFIVTPLALLTASVSLIPGLEWCASIAGWAANLAMQWAMHPIIWLSETKWSMWDVAAMPAWMLCLSLCGVLWALMPPGVPVRWAGWCLILPALVWKPQRPVEGAWRMIALDVGQGSAILVSTHRHDLLFDSGPRLGGTDAGQRVIYPAMRALAVNRLDAMVASHADMDHIGGLPFILKSIAVDSLYASFDAQDWLVRRAKFSIPADVANRELKFVRCEHGQKWIWDQVTFTMLHPQQSNTVTSKKNDNSCVIHISGAFHSAILPGDISVTQENILVQSNKKLRADVVVVAHHGSATSSSPLFVTQMRARHAIVQSGYLNRFKHPETEIIDRWKKQKTSLWRTDQHGAIHVWSGSSSLDVFAYRSVGKRYWHH